MINPISFVALWTLERLSIQFLEITLGNRLEEIKVSFELRVVAIRLYENVIGKFKSNEG